MTHQTWYEPRPQETPAALVIRYQSFCVCGWRQPAPSGKSSHATRAAKRHRARCAEIEFCSFCGHQRVHHSDGGCEVPEGASFCGCAGFNWQEAVP